MKTTAGPAKAQKVGAEAASVERAHTHSNPGGLASVLGNQASLSLIQPHWYDLPDSPAEREADSLGQRALAGRETVLFPRRVPRARPLPPAVAALLAGSA